MSYLAKLPLSDHGQLVASDKDGVPAKETLTTKLAQLKDNVCSTLSAPKELWLKGAELAVALHAMLSTAANSAEKRPFALWEWVEKDDCFNLSYYACKASEFTLRCTTTYDEYVALIKEENAFHLALHERHWAPVLPDDLSTVYWKQGIRNRMRRERKQQASILPRKVGPIIQVSSDEEAEASNEHEQEPASEGDGHGSKAEQQADVGEEHGSKGEQQQQPAEALSLVEPEKAANEQQSPVSVMQVMQEQDVASNVPTNPSTPTVAASQQSQDPPSPPTKAPFV